MAEATDCLFCGSVAGTVPGDIVASSELAVAFRDIHPHAPTHVLGVPREHLVDATAVDPSHGGLLAEMIRLARRVAASEGIGERGYRLVLNVGEDSGNSIGHLHLHVLGGRPLGMFG